jgi:hypothetical protein
LKVPAKAAPSKLTAEKKKEKKKKAKTYLPFYCPHCRRVLGVCNGTPMGMSCTYRGAAQCPACKEHLGRVTHVHISL